MLENRPSHLNPENELKYRELFIYCDKSAGTGYPVIKEKIEALFLGLKINRINFPISSRKILEKAKLKNEDSLLWIMEVSNSQQINELYGLWLSLKKRGIKSVFIILDDRQRPAFESEINKKARESAAERLDIMRKDLDNRLFSLSEMSGNPLEFKCLISSLVNFD